MSIGLFESIYTYKNINGSENIYADLGKIRGAQIEGTLGWKNNTDYPNDCVNSFVSGLGDSLVCSILTTTTGNFSTNGTIIIRGNETTNISLMHNTTALIIGSTSSPTPILLLEMNLTLGGSGTLFNVLGNQSWLIRTVNETFSIGTVSESNSSFFPFFTADKGSSEQVINITFYPNIFGEIITLTGLLTAGAGTFNGALNATTGNFSRNVNVFTLNISSAIYNDFGFIRAHSFNATFINITNTATAKILNATDTVQANTATFSGLLTTENGIIQGNFTANRSIIIKGNETTNITFRHNTTALIIGSTSEPAPSLIFNLTSRFTGNIEILNTQFINGTIRFGSGNTITASAYECGRDDEATNQFHCNVPTGATFELSINDVAQLSLSDSQLQLRTGTDSAPQYSSIGDANSGSGITAADTWGVSTGGVRRARITNTAINFSFITEVLSLNASTAIYNDFGFVRVQFINASFGNFSSRLEAQVINVSSNSSVNTIGSIYINSSNILSLNSNSTLGDAGYVFDKAYLNRIDSKENVSVFIINHQLGNKLGSNPVQYLTDIRVNDSAVIRILTTADATGVMNAKTIIFGTSGGTAPPDTIRVGGIFNPQANYTSTFFNVFTNGVTQSVWAGLLPFGDRGNQPAAFNVVGEINISSVVDDATYQPMSTQRLLCVLPTGTVGICNSATNSSGGCTCV